MSQPHNYAKLPKWAQTEIDRLTRDLASVKKELAAGPDDSDTFVERWGEDTTPLGMGPRIRFDLGADSGETLRFRRFVHAYRREDALFVMGGDLLTVHPRSANTFEVRLAR